MKKKLLLIPMLMALVLVGCVKTSGEAAPPPTNEINLEEESQVVGLLKDRYIENDKKYLELEVDGKVLKIDGSSYEDFGLLEPGSTLDLTYDKKTLSLIKINEIIEDTQEGRAQEETQEPEEKTQGIQIYPVQEISLEGLNECFSLPLEFVSEYKINSVKVYTDAEKNGDEFLFDDGNVFVVLAEGPDGSYELFNKRVQLGGIKVNVYTENDEKLVVSLLETQTAGISFKTFEKTADDSFFVELDHYQGDGNINMIGEF